MLTTAVVAEMGKTDTLGDRVKTLQLHFKLKDAELGKVVGLSKQAIGKWKNQGSIPKGQALINLREKLGVNDLWLLEGQGDMLLRTSRDDGLREIERCYPHLTPAQRETLIQVAHGFLGKKTEQDGE